MDYESKAKIKDILEWVYCIVIAVVLALLVRYFIGTPTIVQQPSMYPTLKQGHRLILNRTIRTFNGTPERGDIITFEAPSKVYVSSAEADMKNPVAEYNHNINGIFSKFRYYVLEDSTIKKSYIKRVIGLPGEQVEIKDGFVYINGEKLEENYLQAGVVTDIFQGNEYDSFATKFIVPENCVFAMGDNRPGSTDCRAFGCIPLEKIEGTVTLRFWPFSEFGGVE